LAALSGWQSKTGLAVKTFMYTFLLGHNVLGRSRSRPTSVWPTLSLLQRRREIWKTTVA
jgi:hypothetical protein